MIDVPLRALANQSLSMPLGDSRYEITVKEATGCMVCTIVRDDVVLVQNVRLLPDAYVLPYDYLEGGEGNFFFAVQDESLPWWESFGLTQFMVWASADEIAGA